MEELYDFDLMEQGGHITGWDLMGEEQMSEVASRAVRAGRPGRVSAPVMAQRDEPVMLFAVGDGNHSLAAAKAYYEETEAVTPPEADKCPPAMPWWSW